MGTPGESVLWLLDRKPGLNPNLLRIGFAHPCSRQRRAERKPQNLTLYTETQLLLLVGDVAADCAHQRHGDGTDNPRDGAHLGRRLCKGASSRGAINWRKLKLELTVVVVVLVDPVAVSTRVPPYAKKKVGGFSFFLFFMYTYSKSYLCLCQACKCHLC